MAFIIDAKGNTQQLTIDFGIYGEAKDANLSVEQYINQKYGSDHDATYGSPFRQVLASEGLLVTPGNKANKFGLRSPTLASIMDGTSGGKSAAANVEKKTDPYGNQSRTLFPIAVVAAIEDAVQPDRTTDDVVFRQMSALTLPISGDTFAQPVLNYNNVGGANTCLLYTSPSPRDRTRSRMPSSA